MKSLHHFARRIRPGRGPALAAALLSLLATIACDQELPTSVGGEHVPESELRTYEVLLDDFVFLEGDTVVRGFGTSDMSSILQVAEDWLGTLDAHALVRFGDFPETVTFVDSGATTVDTILRYYEGRIVVRVDTAALGLDTLGTDTTIAFEMYTVAESFDPRTATWTARRITAADSTAWTTPGGTPGSLIGTGSWTRSDTIAADSMVFTVDSATIAQWATAEEDARGILITTTTTGARVQLRIPRLSLSGRPADDPDTTRTGTSVITGQTFVYDPPPADPVDVLRLGDRSAWRSYVTFRGGLDTIVVACPGVPGCTFTLGDAAINRADLLLSPLVIDEMHRPLANFGIEARPVLGGESVPLERAPLGDTTGIVLSISRDRFDGVDDEPVEIPVTRFFRGLVAAGEDSLVTSRNRTLSLLSAPEPLPYGIVGFHGHGSFSGQPVLRLIVTVPPRGED